MSPSRIVANDVKSVLANGSALLVTVTMAGLAFTTGADHVLVTPDHLKANFGLGVTFLLLDAALMIAGAAMLGLLFLYIILLFTGSPTGQRLVYEIDPTEGTRVERARWIAKRAKWGCYLILAACEALMASVVIGFLWSRLGQLPFSHFHGSWTPPAAASLSYEVVFMGLGVILAGLIFQAGRVPRSRRLHD